MEALLGWFGCQHIVDAPIVVSVKPIWMSRFFDHGGKVDVIFSFENNFVKLNRLGRVYSLLLDTITLNNNKKYYRNDLTGLTLTTLDGGHNVMVPIRVHGQKFHEGRGRGNYCSYLAFFLPLKVKSL